MNADVRLWTRTSAGGSWSLHDQFTTDPFGDEFNTIGLQISTKKRGAISASCLLGDDDPDKDCSSDLDDVTLYYKDASHLVLGNATRTVMILANRLSLLTQTVGARPR